MTVAVVGAGPGGLFVAEQCAVAGLDVTVFDQRRSPARKFVLAGRGGLNITHTEPIESFLDRYGPDRVHLEPMIRAFDPEDLQRWVADLGEPTFVGTSGRVFPQSFRAVPLLRAWMTRLVSQGVKFEFDRRWTGWAGAPHDRTLRFDAPSGPDRTFSYDAAVLALGGASWPRVGGDGSWVETLRSAGVHVSDLAPTNCGVHLEWSPVLIDRFAGTPLKNVAVTIDGATVRGDPIVTRSGLEGGPIYAHARRVREQIARAGSAVLSIDLVPDIDEETLHHRLETRHRAKRSVSTWLDRVGLPPVAVALMRESTGNRLPTEPGALAALAKSVECRVLRLASIERAISTAGGVRWDAVDDTLQLLTVPDVYVTGEMLDWEAPTGGYLLQGVFSTANHVGRHLTAEIRGDSAP